MCMYNVCIIIDSFYVTEEFKSKYYHVDVIHNTYKSVQRYTQNVLENHYLFICLLVDICTYVFNAK